MADKLPVLHQIATFCVPRVDYPASGADLFRGGTFLAKAPVVMRWIPVIGWMLLIFIGSTDAFSAERTSRFVVPFLLWFDPHLSIAAALTIHIGLRKFGHVIAYAVLAALLWRALRVQAAFLRRLWFAALLAFVAAGIHAALDEFYQSFVPSRTASAHDVAIDLGGALIGLAIYWLFTLRRKPQIVY